MRKILVHYHLFKNAGSSVDHLLKSAYGSDQWVNHDPGDPPHIVPSSELLKFIEENEHLRAMSSHMLVPPLPAVEGLSVYPIVFIREPITRVMSAYLFEWKKQKGLEEPSGTLADYIHSKFSSPRTSAIEDFQCLRLANKNPNSHKPDSVRTDEDILQAAKDFLESLEVFGLVDRFSESMSQFERAYGESFPEVTFQDVAMNTTQKVSTTLQERYKKIENEIGSELYSQLILRNQMDIKLYNFACGLFARQQS